MIINTSEQLSKLIEELKKEGNLLYPLSFCDSIAPMHRVSVRRLHISGNPEDMEVYHPKQVPQGKYALTKISLLRLDLALGLNWIADNCGRIDDGSDQFYVRYYAEAEIQDLDGSKRKVNAEITLDYRDGSIALEGLTSGDIRNRRMSIAQRCETAAKNRIRRDAAGVKPVYTLDELKRPFIVLKLVENLPQRYDDAVAASMMGVDKAIFGESTRVDTISVPELIPEENGLPKEPEKQENTKEELVKQINDLYFKKLGHGRPANKTPLENLSEEQLQEVLQALSK